MSFMVSDLIVVCLALAIFLLFFQLMILFLIDNHIDLYDFCLKLIAEPEKEYIETFIPNEFNGAGTILGSDVDDEIWTYALPSTNFPLGLNQTPYQTSLLYQNPYQITLPNLFFPSYHDPLSTILGPLSYQDPFTQFFGQYPNPFAPDNSPLTLPDYSSRMYVMGTSYGDSGDIVYLIIEDNGEGPPKDPEELGNRARKYIMVEEYNSTFSLNSSGKTCDICLYQEFLGFDRVWAWAEKWWPLEDF